VAADYNSELNRKRVQSAEIEVISEHRSFRTQPKIRTTAAQRAEGNLRLQPGERSAKAEMGAGSECHVFVIRTAHIKAIPETGQGRDLQRV
jgi:hypothetical protein